MRHCIFALLVALAPGIHAESPSCDAPLVALDHTLSSHGLEDRSEARYTVDVPAPGVLAVEAAVPAYEDGLPWIEIVPAPCGDGDAGEARVLSRSLSRQVIAIPAAGTYILRLGNVLPHGSLERYWVATRFIDRTRLEGIPHFPPPGDTGGISDKDGDDDNGAEESDNEIVPLIFIDPTATDPGLDALPWCATSVDPEVDLSFCARRLPVGEVLSGELDPGRDADRDEFTFTLDRTARVHLATRGDTDTFGSLYDVHGHRLARSDDGGEGENFALSATLVPGRYVVRVEGAWGASGAYGLTLSVLEPWAAAP